MIPFQLRHIHSSSRLDSHRRPLLTRFTTFHHAVTAQSFLKRKVKLTPTHSSTSLCLHTVVRYRSENIATTTKNTSSSQIPSSSAKTKGRKKKKHSLISFFGTRSVFPSAIAQLKSPSRNTCARTHTSTVQQTHSYKARVHERVHLVLPRSLLSAAPAALALYTQESGEPG